VDAELTPEQTAAVSMLLQSGKTIREIAKFADLDVTPITAVARTLDIEPALASHKRAKALFGSTEALTYQAIAKKLDSEGFSADDGEKMHHLTVASWVKNYGWPWGGAADGDYAPERTSPTAARTKYMLRLSKSREAELNTDQAIAAAAAHAWQQLASDETRVVQVAVIRGAAETGTTDVKRIKQALMEAHGEELRTATL